VDTKNFAFELVEAKAATDGWQFSGYVSTYDLDDGGDIVEPGAFDRTLKERAFRPLLWGHDQRLPPIGMEKSLSIDEKGLLGTWDLLDTSLGTDVYRALKAGAIRSMSIGYQAMDYIMGDDGIRHLTDVELLESSLVNVPMNAAAVVTSVKAAVPEFKTDIPFADLLKQLDQWFTMSADEAKALIDRRGQDERKLSDAHLDSMRATVAAAEAYAKTMAALIDDAQRPPEALQRKQEQAERLARLKRLGVL
jgi:HK97 family phage prohead protease